MLLEICMHIHSVVFALSRLNLPCTDNKVIVQHQAQGWVNPNHPLAYALVLGRNEVKWHQGQETSLASPRSNLGSFGNKFTALKNAHVTLLGLSSASRNHLAPPAAIRRPHSDSATG